MQNDSVLLTSLSTGKIRDSLFSIFLLAFDSSFLLGFSVLSQHMLKIQQRPKRRQWSLDYRVNSSRTSTSCIIFTFLPQKKNHQKPKKTTTSPNNAPFSLILFLLKRSWRKRTAILLSGHYTDEDTGSVS